ncbi:MAG: hypothetical protein RIM84_04835 [Alphaproteobacteria bacterium]
MDKLDKTRSKARKSGTVEAWRAVLALAPEDPEAHFQVGNAALADGDAATAVARYRRARAVAPDVEAVAANLATALAALGLAEQDAGRHQVAAETFREALPLSDSPILRNNLALSLIALRQFDAAIDLLRPLNDLAAQRNLAQALELAGRHEQARRTWEALQAAMPGDADALAHLFHASLQTCAWDELDSLKARLAATIDGDPCPALPLFALQGMELTTTQARRAAKSAAPAAEPLPARPLSSGLLTVGYLSPDLRGHSVGRSLAAVFAAHDRAKLHVVGYAVGDAAPDDVGLDRVADLRHRPAEAIAETIAEDGVDILVDLAGPTRGGALEVLARHPAPLSAHYFGYGGSLGGLVDYLVSDATHLPDPADVAEAVVHLPGSFFVAAQPAIGSTTRSEHDLPDDAKVLMNLNAPYKTQPAMFRAWLDILARRDDAVLWLLDGGSQANNRLRGAAGAQKNRLVFAPAVDHATHAARQTLADVALDTYPHGGGVTTLDALAAGVPVVTLTGATPASRTGASILHAAGMPGLLCDNVGDYVATVLAMLDRRTPPGALSLFNPAARAKQLKTAFEKMADRHRAGLPPASFTVEDTS